MDGRNLCVFDMSGNGLQDIFIVCVRDPHLLLLQVLPGVFEEHFIPNTFADNGNNYAGVIYCIISVVLIIGIVMMCVYTV